MKALGGQWLNWQEQASTDWTQAGVEDVVRMAPRGEPMRNDIGLVLPIVAGPWMELARSGEEAPPTSRAIEWVQKNQGVSSVLVAVASVDELEEAVGDRSSSQASIAAG